MKARRVLVAVVGLTAVLGVANAFGTPTAITWGKAIEAPGTAALNTGGIALVNSLSCRSAGTCAAGGYYNDNANQAFVEDEKQGVWKKAIQVPGIAALSGPGGGSVVNSVSCGSTGNCVAGGSYYNSTSQAFLASKTNGVWGNAIEVPGSGDLNTAGSAGVQVVSCPSAGNCAAGGYYYDSVYGYEVFVIDETNGVWGNAVEVPGTASLNTGGNDFLNSISCRPAGNCSAGGWYFDGTKYRAFVATETNGVWADAIEVPGSDALNTGGEAAVTSVSCTGAGMCTAGGYYRVGSSDFEAFVVSEKNGVWGDATPVPNLATLNTNGHAVVNSISCASTGNCSAGGIFRAAGDSIHGFVATETNGKWAKAVEVPGSAALTSSYMTVRTVSCAAAGWCLAGGFYQDGGGAYQAFVVRQTSGSWRKAVKLGGTAALNTGGAASVTSISCFKSGRCGVAGDYSGTPDIQAFVTP